MSEPFILFILNVSICKALINVIIFNAANFIHSLNDDLNECTEALCNPELMTLTSKRASRSQTLREQHYSVSRSLIKRRVSLDGDPPKAQPCFPKSPPAHESITAGSLTVSHNQLNYYSAV